MGWLEWLEERTEEEQDEHEQHDLERDVGGAVIVEHAPEEQAEDEEQELTVRKWRCAVVIASLAIVHARKRKS